MDDSVATYAGQLIEPEKIAFSFEAPGWKWLFIAIALHLTIFIIILILKYIKNAYRRKAIQKVDEIALLSDESELIYQLVLHLKMWAMQIYGREALAGQERMHWINFLNDRQTDDFFNIKITSRVLMRLYNKNAPVSQVELREFIYQLKNWIRKHKA